MKKNVIATLCAAVLAAVIVVPAFLMNQPAGSAPISDRHFTTAVDASGDPSGEKGENDAPTAPDALNPEESGVDGKTDAAANADPGNLPRYKAGTVLVGLADGVTADQASARLADFDFIATKSVADDDILYGYVKLDLVEGAEVEQAVRVLEQADFVSAAQPNYVYQLLDEDLPDGWDAASDAAAGPEASQLQAQSLQPGSADLGAQSTTINDPKSLPAAAEQWMLTAINAYEAWDYARTNNSVTVAVLDSGINANHEDLKDRIVNSYSVFDGGISDTYGHGTHVAGIVAATANNSKGVAGVSYNAKIMPVKVIDNNGSVDSWDAAEGVDWIVNHRNADPSAPVRIINMSFGGPLSAEEASSDKDIAFLSAIDAAQDAGLLVVCAAGNYANTKTHKSGGEALSKDEPYRCFPCDFDADMVGVINLTHEGTEYTRATGSNFNMPRQTTKDISAPGDEIYSTTKDGKYGYKSGTSMSTPCVSGVAALLFAAKPSLTAAEVKQILQDTATDLYTDGFDRQSGYGMVNAKAALANAVPNAAPVITGNAAMAVGGTTQLSVANSTKSWSWSSADTAIATVSASGLVTGQTAGATVINASAGDITISYNVYVYDPTITGNSSMEFGASQTLSVVSSDLPGTWTWTSSDTSVATVGRSSGVVVARSLGSTDITVTLESNHDVTFTKRITVVAADLEGATLHGVGGTGDQLYTGEPITLPTDANNPRRFYVTMPAAYAASGSTELVLGQDYEVEYADNENVGTATVTVTGKGNYTGTQLGHFRIGHATITGSTITSTETYAFTGNAISLKNLVAKGPKGETLVNGRDFTISYENNVNAGVATATLTGTGNYVGAELVYFLINPASIMDVQVSGIENRTYTGEAQTQSPRVTYNGHVLEEGTDYTISYLRNVNAAKSTDGSKAPTVRLTGKGNFEAYTFAWSNKPRYAKTPILPTTVKTCTFTIGQATIADAEIAVSDQTYTGKELKPTPTVVIGERTLSQGIDYSYDYSKNTNVGTASVNVYGKGNYAGMAFKSFKINAAPIASASITLSTTRYTYDGTAKKPSVTVVFNGTVLRNGTDYSLSYTNCTNVGTATVTITGKGNFTGFAYRNYTIEGSGSGGGGSSGGGSSGGGSSGGSVDPDNPIEHVEKQMHRLYNPNSYEHFFTSDDSEFAYLVSLGWQDEGIGWTSAASGSPVYRLYNPNDGGDHHYTKSLAERNMLIGAGWLDEGARWYSSEGSGVPVYREYNPNMPARNHNYTRDYAEHVGLISLGWRDEGIAWYGV